MSKDLKLVKELRNKTGAGFLDCKEALINSKNNLDLAIDSLRKKGLAKASKKSSREAKEGAVAIYLNENFVVILKINSETDFSAKSDTFLNFVDILGNLALSTNDSNLNLDKFLNVKKDNKLVSDLLTEMIAKIGENIILSHLEVVNRANLELSFYVHNPYRTNIGKIISFILYKSIKIDENIKILSKNICMHIAALKPEAIHKDELDKEIIEKEINIQKELIINSGKPSNVVDKILEGKMKKFFSEVTLLNQNFVIDPEKTIKEVIDSYSKNYSYELLKYNLITLE